MRALLGVLVALAAVAVLRLILGPTLATVVIAPAFWMAIIGGWALLERRMFDTPRPAQRAAGPVIDVSSRAPTGTVAPGPPDRGRAGPRRLEQASAGPSDGRARPSGRR